MTVYNFTLNASNAAQTIPNDPTIATTKLIFRNLSNDRLIIAGDNGLPASPTHGLQIDGGDFVDFLAAPKSLTPPKSLLSVWGPFAGQAFTLEIV